MANANCDPYQPFIAIANTDIDPGFCQPG